MSDTLFTRIIQREIPAKIRFEDADYIVIDDINPQAPVHLLVITKKPIPSLNDLTDADRSLVGGMFIIAHQEMAKQGQTDYRTIFNCGPLAGQEVPHLHLHVLAGRKMQWPPG